LISTGGGSTGRGSPVFMVRTIARASSSKALSITVRPLGLSMAPAFPFELFNQRLKALDLLAGGSNLVKQQRRRVEALPLKVVDVLAIESLLTL
jgi:hypothetical protein